MYNELSRFYVVANLYEQDTCIGMHSDFNVCCAVPPQHQVVLRCNVVADGVLWISPTTNSIEHDVSGNKAIAWIKATWSIKTADNDKLRYYGEQNLVIPVWCTQHSVLVMGGTFLIQRVPLDREEGGYVAIGCKTTS